MAFSNVILSTCMCVGLGKKTVTAALGVESIRVAGPVPDMLETPLSLCAASKQFR